jgi:RimJ/RimL family protein N-acetyltransferase
MEIQTSRFLLRDFRDGDSAVFESYHCDPRFLEFYGDEVADPEHAQRLVERFRQWAAEHPRRNYQLAIVPIGSSELIGCAGLRCEGAAPGTGEMGIGIAPDYWGQYGYAAEVISALAYFGFELLKLESLFGSTVSGNSRIGRLMEAIGARSVQRPTPSWMAAKGWQQIEWHLSQQEWSNSLLAQRWNKPEIPSEQESLSVG